jgi:DNA-binding transcriptional LysR family regulator
VTKRRPPAGTPAEQAANGLQRWRLQPPSIFSYLDAVAHHGSIRKAAEALHVASSALNRRILDLEADVGSPLFERLPRGVRATAAGELFLAYVRRSLKELRLVEAQIDGLRGLVHGRVHVAVAETRSRTTTSGIPASASRSPSAGRASSRRRWRATRPT